MWNALNNGGIIKAQQFKDYKGALKDFNRIIKIETNRYDGEINAIRLESGYTNRAYVRKMQGQNDAACDDLYEALSLGVEGFAKLHDVDAALAQCRADRRARIGLPRRNLQLQLVYDLFRHTSVTPFLLGPAPFRPTSRARRSRSRLSGYPCRDGSLRRHH